MDLIKEVLERVAFMNGTVLGDVITNSQVLVKLDIKELLIMEEVSKKLQALKETFKRCTEEELSKELKETLDVLEKAKTENMGVIKATLDLIIREDNFSALEQSIANGDVIDLYSPAFKLILLKGKVGAFRNWVHAIDTEMDFIDRIIKLRETTPKIHSIFESNLENLNKDEDYFIKHIGTFYERAIKQFMFVSINTINN